MENKFYTDDDFEHFLKDATDNFRMYPSKKVWYSIYNDLHPSRKWPSLAVCLVLVAAILFVGVSNNNSINQSNKTVLANNLSQSNNTTATNTTPLNATAAQSSNNDVVSVAKINLPAFGTNANTTIDAGITGNFFPSGNENTDAVSYETSSSLLKNNSLPTGSNGGNENGTTVINDRSVNNQNSGASTNLTAKGKSTVHIRHADDDNNEDNATEENGTTGAVAANNTPVDLLKAPAVTNSNSLAANKTAAVNNEMNMQEKAWIENFALNNKSAKSRFKLKSEIQYYVTPSVGFRFLKKNYATEPVNPVQPQLVSAGTNVETAELGINDEVTQKSAMNLEAGISWLYNISKKIKLKAGVQINYTSYISFADALKHPSQTYILLNAPDGGFIMQPRMSSFANSINGEKRSQLNNKTVQLSLPIGADFKLAGKHNLKWYAGATIQPTLVTGGHVYAISADTQSYVEDNSLLRKWNMSAGVETFISYKMPSGITLNAGPQVRYQLMSTYSDKYSYSEKLYNIGVKLGITKTF